jgi:hypothetical protein
VEKDVEKKESFALQLVQAAIYTALRILTLAENFLCLH